MQREDLGIMMSSCFPLNETESCLQCGLEGLGPIRLLEFVASPYLKSGRLKQVLADARCSPVPVSIVYPQGRHASAATRTCVDWLVDIGDHRNFKRGKQAA